MLGALRQPPPLTWVLKAEVLHPAMVGGHGHPGQQSLRGTCVAITQRALDRSWGWGVARSPEQNLVLVLPRATPARPSMARPTPTSSKEGPLSRDTASTWPWYSWTWGLGSMELGVLSGCQDVGGAHPCVDGGHEWHVRRRLGGPAGSSGKDQAAQSGWHSGPVSTRQGASQQIPWDGKVRKPPGWGSETQVPSRAWPHGHWEPRAGTRSASPAVTLPVLLPGHGPSRRGDGPP